MLNKIMYAFFVILSFSLISCSPKQSEIVVAEFGDYEIKMNEFEKAYSKNVGSVEKAKQDSIENYRKFLDLYVNFKMKLRDAEVRKLQDDSAIVNELNEYEKTIGASYLLEKELFNKGLQTLYDKRSEELRVSHLLIRTDTLSDEQAKQKANDIINRIQAGSSFEDEVREHSDDQFSKTKGGDIYFITAGTVMPSFEDIAFSTPVGSVNPTPLKTKYGYHIIKVTERKKRIPQIRASHILIRKEGVEGTAGDKSPKDVANEILEKAKSGEDFGKLAAEYSEDPGSKTKMGDLGFFSRRQMVQPFDEAAFNLEVGEISDLVESQFGYHIIKVTERKEYPSFESERKSLRDIFEKTRRKSDYDELIVKYSKEVNFVIYDDVFKNVISNAGGVVFSKDYWESDFHSSSGSKVLFSIGENKYTTDSLMTYALKDSKNMGQIADSKKLTDLLTNYKNDKVIETKAKLLVNDDPEFASLMKEYKNGIFIFKLQEDEVWNKMKMDSTEIHALYDETKESYIWPDRVKYSELYTKSDSLANEYFKMLKDGAEFDSLVAKYNEKRNSKNKVGEFINADNSVLSKAAFDLNNEGDLTEIIANSNGWSILRLDKKDPSRIKTFSEARAEVTSTYQDVESSHLENSYVSRLKNVYSPKLFYEELENAYKK